MEIGMIRINAAVGARRMMAVLLLEQPPVEIAYGQ